MVYKSKKKSNPKKRLAASRYKKITGKSPNRSRSASRARSVQLFDKMRPRIEGHAAGGTISMFRYINSSKRYSSFINKEMKNQAPYTATYCTAQMCRSLQGKQAAFTLEAPIQGGSVPSFFTTIQLKQFSQNMTSSDWARYWIDHVTATYMMRNNTNNEMILDLYDCVYRRDTSVQDDPVVIWGQGDLNAGGNVFDYQFPGATPFQSPTFTSMFKVEKVTNCILPAGSCHEHKVHYSPKRMFNSNDCQYNYAFRGLSRFTIAVFRGVPVQIAGADDVTLSETQLSIVSQAQYVTKVVMRAVPTNISTSGLDGIGDVKFINDETGVMETLVTAS